MANNPTVHGERVRIILCMIGVTVCFGAHVHSTLGGPDPLNVILFIGVLSGSSGFIAFGRMGPARLASSPLADRFRSARQSVLPKAFIGAVIAMALCRAGLVIAPDHGELIAASALYASVMLGLAMILAEINKIRSLA